MSEAISPVNNDWEFLRNVYANTCNDNEFKVFQHLTETYNLDPISKEIWCIKTKNQPARIFVSRDGHLAIAHRSGHWGGIKTVYDWGDEKQYVEVRDKYSEKVLGKVLVPFSATCIIYRTDSSYPTEHTVFWDEYGSNQSLWLTKPKTMLQKVAECQCLRRAFDMHGFYSPEEFSDIPLDSVIIQAPNDAKLSEDSMIDLQKRKLGINDYNESQMHASLNLYTENGLDKAIFEKAKISDGHWDKDLIVHDYQKQMKAKGLFKD